MILAGLLGCIDFGDEAPMGWGMSVGLECTEAPELRPRVQTFGPVRDVTFHVVLPSGEEDSVELPVLDRAKGTFEGTWDGPAEWESCADAYVATYTISGVGYDGTVMEVDAYVDGDPEGFETPGRP